MKNLLIFINDDGGIARSYLKDGDLYKRFVIPMTKLPINTKTSNSNLFTFFQFLKEINITNISFIGPSSSTEITDPIQYIKGINLEWQPFVISWKYD